MKTKTTFILAMLLSIYSIANAQNCGTNIFTDTFDGTGDLPTGWTEYNTSGQVSVEDGQLKLDFTADKPSVYRTFDAETGYLTLSFDVQSTRNWVVAKMHLTSSSGKYITSLVFGNNGTKNIQYATALEGGVPTAYDGALLDASYGSNTNYSVSVKINFQKQTLDFYQGGDVKAAGIPFLESAVNIVKIDIQQLGMYSNEGRFFFDNIALDEETVDRSGLSAAVSSVGDMTFSVILSPKYGYSQESYDALKTASSEAEVVLNNCDATQAQIDTAEESVTTAIAAFEESYKDEVVLKLYSGSQLQGDVKAMKCGYYNGTLTDFDNKAVSFHLEKGYMLTVAQNVNGTGVSKVYIAADDELRLNFPEDLQQSISFLRVGPWRYTEKKGSSGKSANNDVVLALNGDWFYDWGNADKSMTECEYVPMNFSGTSNTVKLGQDMSFTHHLAFNEPDGSNQANMTVDVAITKYEALQGSGLRLGAPAVTDGAKGREWLDEFMTKAIAAGYRVDFIPVHYYKIMGTDAFIAWLKDFYDEYQVPIWVTEFNYGDIWASNEKDKTEAQILSSMTAYCEAMDKATFVERYCVFTWQPSDYGNHSLMSVRSPITLNTVGEFYANHASPEAYLQETYENGPDLSAGLATGLEESGIRFSPNPVEGAKLQLDYSEDIKSQNLYVKLYTVSGQEVMVQSNSPESLDVSKLKNGVYLLRIEGAGISFSEKLIINH